MALPTKIFGKEIFSQKIFLTQIFPDLQYMYIALFVCVCACVLNWLDSLFLSGNLSLALLWYYGWPPFMSDNGDQGSEETTSSDKSIIHVLIFCSV